jgi:hypothetical protein
MAKRELVRVEKTSALMWSVFIGDVSVCSFYSQKEADDLAAAIGAELQKEFEQRARWVAKESRYREVKHY